MVFCPRLVCLKSEILLSAKTLVELSFSDVLQCFVRVPPLLTTISDIFLDATIGIVFFPTISDYHAIIQYSI